MSENLDHKIVKQNLETISSNFFSLTRSKVDTNEEKKIAVGRGRFCKIYSFLSKISIK